ncbi:multidrug efflux SMR transporter [Methylocystis sp. IM3]|jgi:quaternary ammonium compound-resistance protein SugE|uniref:DMT family transporter n=1 Tax=unclassified Methylocystis TaxID=2625913 RepID=UPI000FABDDA9|nr:MAG: multidrug efflux SMR transporter [Hyphomicrobiales bacterium]
MSWIILLFAALFEIAWAVWLKAAGGFTRLWPSIGILAAMGASAGLLALAVRTLPIGSAYAVWTGLGAAGTATTGIFWFGEPATPLRLCSIALVVLGVVGLRLTE